MWWKIKTGLPLPLGGNVIRKDIAPAVRSELNAILRESIRYGLEHRAAGVAHAMPLARDMDTALADKFIGMYVNDFTLDYGDTGRKAIREFLGRPRGGADPRAGGIGICGVACVRPSPDFSPGNEPQDFALLGFGGDDAAALFAGDIGVFEAVAGDGADDACCPRECRRAGRRRPGVIDAFEKAGDGLAALAGSTKMPSCAASHCWAARISSSVTISMRAAAIRSIAVVRAASSSRGCRCGWRWRRSRDRMTRLSKDRRGAGGLEADTCAAACAICRAGEIRGSPSSRR